MCVLTGNLPVSLEINTEVTQTAVPLLATRDRLQKRVTPIDSHVKMLDFTAEINMFTVWGKNRF